MDQKTWIWIQVFVSLAIIYGGAALGIFLMKKAKEDCRGYKIYVAIVCAGFTAFLVWYGFYRTNLPI